MSLKTQSLQEFNPRSTEHQFKWSLGKTILPTVLFSLLSLLCLNELLVIKPFTEIPTFPLAIGTLGFVLCTWVAWIQTKAGLGKNALVAALDNKNLWIRVRSPLNAHVGATENNLLVALPLDKLQWSQIVSVRTTKISNNKPRTTFEEFLDLGAKEFDFDSLRALLEAERVLRKAASQSHLHFPIKLLDDDRMRVSFHNVSGGASALQQKLPSAMEVREKKKEVKDLR